MIAVMRRAMLAFGIVGMCALACTSLDGLSTPTTDADADAGAEGGATGECAANPANLLTGQNEGFEDGCALWTPDRVNLEATTTSACGKQACRVCPFYPGQGGLFRKPTRPLAQGERYVFSAKLKRDNGETAKAHVAFGIEGTEVGALGSFPLMSEWGPSTATFDVPAEGVGKELKLSVLNSVTADGECFLVDDAVLLVTPGN